MELLRRLLPSLLRWPVALAWMALIFVGSSVPAEVVTAQARIPFDKLAHFGEYSVLAFLFVGVARRQMRCNEGRILQPESRRDAKGVEMTVITSIDHGNVKRGVDEYGGQLVLPWRAVEVVVEVAREVVR